MTLYLEQIIWIAKITLKRRDGTSSDTFYLSDDYWKADGIYSGSPEVLPLLSKTPKTDIEIEIETAARADITLEILNNADFRTWNERFSDLLVTHSLQGAAVDLLRYTKGVDSTTTHSDSVNIRQSRCEVIDHQLVQDSGILRVVARDVWFKDKEISKKLRDEDFTALDPDFNGIIGPWVFGYDKNSTFGVIIDAPFIDWVEDDYFRLFGGWVSDGHYMNEASVVFVRNRPNEYNQSDWVTCELNTATTYIPDYEDLSATPAINLGNGDVGYIVSVPTTGAHIVYQVELWAEWSHASTSPTTEMGRLTAQLYFSVDGQPVGNALGEALFDHTQLIYGGIGYPAALFERPILMTFGQLYFLKLSWSGNDNTLAPLIYQGTDTGSQYYYNQKSVAGSAFQPASANDMIAVKMLCISRRSPYFDDGSTNGEYAYFDINDPQQGTAEYLTDNLQFKLGYKGLEDNSGNTFGAGASSLISTPARLVDFVLREDDRFGLGLTTSEVDTSGISSVATLQDAANIDFGISIEQTETAESFIRKLCRQSRTIFYKKRNGKLSLYYPQSITTTTVLDWGRLRADMQTIEVGITEPSKIVNDFLISYAKDPLNRPKSIEVQRKAEADKFSSVYAINGTESTDSDTIRETNLAASETLFGKREFRENWEYLYDQSGVMIGAKYLVDRFSRPQKRIRVRILAKDFASLDIFSDVDCRAYGLECENGSFGSVKTFDTNSSGTRFATVAKLWESTPVDCYQTGRIIGRVLKIEEEGPFVYLRIEQFPDL